MRKLFSTKYSEAEITLAATILRLGFGILLLHHGYGKLQHFPTYSQHFVDPFHIGQATTLSLVVFAEFFCSALVIIGLLTRLACIPIIFDLICAVIYGHHYEVFGKGEMASLFVVGFLALLFTGPGKVSIDRLIRK